MGPFLLSTTVTLCTFLITRSVVRGMWAFRLPCAAVGLWAAGMFAVPIGAVVSLTVLLKDEHTWELANLAPVSLATVSSVGLLTVTACVARKFWLINAAARQQRRRHEMLIDLFATQRPDLAKVDVIPDPRLFAYSVPCVVSGRVVVSQGTLDLLDEAPLRAVVIHERAHLFARHHLLLQLATAVGETFRRSALATALPARITQLIEMVADCHARRRVGQQPTITALTSLADMATPTGALPIGGRAVELRLAHLRASEHCCETARGKGARTITVALLVLPLAVGYLNRVIDICFWK